MKFLRIISICVLLVGCSSEKEEAGNKMINVSIYDLSNANAEAMSMQIVRGIKPNWAELEEKHTTTGVVKVADHKWTPGASGHWIVERDGEGWGEIVKTTDSEGVTAVQTFMGK